MKKHLFILSILMFFCAIIAQAQTLTIQGRVINAAAEQQGVPYVNIGFPAYAIGTSSNELGDFIIKIPQESLKDTLTFSSIGYVTLKIAVKELINKGENAVISLKTNAITLDEFTIKAVDANRIIKSFFKNLEKNYATEPALMQVFCREITKKADENLYFTQSEGITEMYKSSVKKNDDQVRLIKGRKKNLSNIYVNQAKRSVKIPEIVNGPTTGIILDVVKNKASFMVQNWQFTFSHNGYERLNDRLAYVLHFSPKDTSKRILQTTDSDFYTGKIFIDTASFALMRAEFDLSTRGIRVINLESQRTNLPLIITKRRYVVSYAEYNNKWYLKSANVDNNYTHLDAKIELTNKLEAFVTEIKTDAVKKFPKSQEIKADESLSNKITDFDDSFWEDYNVIKAAETIGDSLETDAPTLANADTLVTPKKSKITPLIVDKQSNKHVNFFKGDIREAQKLAAAQKKFIFIDVYTTWCRPCKQMAAEAFTDAEISELMNTFFINMQVDAEAGGRMIAGKYNVKAYPTTLIIDSTGAIIAENRGYEGVNIFLNQIEKAVALTATGNMYLVTKNAYLTHKKDINYLSIFANTNKKLGISNESLTDAVVRNLPLDSLKEVHFQQFISNFSTEPDGKTFDFILKNRDFLLFENKLTLLVQKNFNVAVQNKDKNLLKRVLKANEKIIKDPSVSEEKNAQLMVKYYEKTNNYKGYHESATDLLTLHYLPKLDNMSDSLTRDYQLKIEQIGGYYSDNIKEKKQLQVVAELINKACAKHECTAFVRIYAQLLYRLNETDKAKEWINKALKLSGNSKEIADILDRMNKGTF